MENHGVYEIGNAGQLHWFMQQVNSGSKEINAVLTADIDMADYSCIPIAQTGLYYGVTTYPDSGYTGTFDGRGHVISNLTVPASSIADTSYGLFGTVSGTVKNLGIHSFNYTGAGMDSRVGAVAGQMLDGSVVENCYAIDININTKFNTENGVAGGIAGCNYGGTVRNCFTDDVTITAARYGGILGDNCADGNNADGTDRPGTMDNCYTSHIYLRDTTMLGNAPSGEAGVTAEWFASGEIAYLLQGEQKTEVWGQTIGTEDYPVLGGEAVYKVKKCDGTTETYSNKNENESHTLENCVCTVCGANDHQETAGYENGFCPNGCFEPAVLNGDVYEISNAGQLYWFAAKMNGGETAINGKLTKNIVVNEGTMSAETTGARAWTPISADPAPQKYYFNGTPYTGIFNGNNKTVSGLYFNDTKAEYVGLFGCVGKDGGIMGEIRNVGVVNFWFCGKDTIGGVAGYNEGTVTGCYSTGTVIGENSVGGVVGYHSGSTVTNCYSTATVSGSYAGGVVGENNYGTVANCYSTAAVNGSGDNVGGVAGYNGTASRVINSYFNRDTYQGDAVGFSTNAYVYAEGKTSAQFASGEVAYLLSRGCTVDADNATYSGDIWGQDLDNGKSVQNAPTFTGGPVYYGYASCGDAEMKYTNTSTAGQTKPDHSYTAVFNWQSNLSGAEAVVSCDNCTAEDTADCTISSVWNQENGELTVTATAQYDGKTFTDTQTIKLTVVSGKLTITNSAAEADEGGNATIIVAAYESGQMTGCQVIEDITGVTEINLTVTGDDLMVFFLNPDTHAPLLAGVEL